MLLSVLFSKDEFATHLAFLASEFFDIINDQNVTGVILTHEARLIEIELRICYYDNANLPEEETKRAKKDQQMVRNIRS
jgi:hypothetical protein